MTTSVDRVALSELPSYLRVLHGDTSVILHADLYGNSEVLKKMSDGDGLVHTNDKDMFYACTTIASLPTSPRELMNWFDAYDFLCATPPPEWCLAALTRACRRDLSGRQSLIQCAQAVHRSYVPLYTRISKRTSVARSFCENTENLPRAGTYTSAPPNDTDMASSVNRPLLPSVSLSSRGLWIRELSGASSDSLVNACQRMWKHAHSLRGEVSSMADKMREVIRSVLLGMGDNISTAPAVIHSARQLSHMLTHEEVRWVTRRAMVVMNAMEDSPHAFFVSALYVRELQGLYRDGILDLNSLCHLPEAFPSENYAPHALYLLPGCPGRQEVSAVEVDISELRSSLIRKTPWLEALWKYSGATATPCYVTGSALTAALVPSTGASVLPGDVDIFIEPPSCLDAFLELVRKSVEERLPSTVLSSTKMSETKLRLTLTTSREGVDSVEFADLYTHPLQRIARYHLSVVRAAFDGRTLYCTPSAASALVTSVSADFAIKWKPERARHIIWRKWVSGLNLLVNRTELRMFLRYAKRNSQNISPRLRLALRTRPEEEHVRTLKFNRRAMQCTESHARARLRWRT